MKECLDISLKTSATYARHPAISRSAGVSRDLSASSTPVWTVGLTATMLASQHVSANGALTARPDFLTNCVTRRSTALTKEINPAGQKSPYHQRAHSWSAAPECASVSIVVFANREETAGDRIQPDRGKE